MRYDAFAVPNQTPTCGRPRRMIEMRPSRTALAVTALLSMLLACPVPAQARRLPPAEQNTPNAIRALHRFAHCVAHSHWQRERARALLAMDYRTDAYRDAMRAQAAEHGMCLQPHQSLSFNIL